jgi:hypothetical protein
MDQYCEYILPINDKQVLLYPPTLPIFSGRFARLISLKFLEMLHMYKLYNAFKKSDL